MGTLVLPRLDARIPRVLVPAPLIRANAHVSRLLMESGVIQEADIPDTWGQSLEACQHAIYAWIRREVGPLRCLEPSVGLWIPQESHQMPEPEGLKFYWLATQKHQWPVGEALDRLEERVPGLGRAVLSTLTWQRVYPLFAPKHAFDCASYLYWQGEIDEETALSERLEECENEAECETVIEEMVTRTMLDDAYPPWALLPSILKRRHFVRFLQNTLRQMDGKERDIIEAALSVWNLPQDRALRQTDEVMFVGHGGVLAWTEDDLTVQIFNDLLDYAGEMDYTDVMGDGDVAPTASWCKSLQTLCRAIARIDHLIALLSA